MLNVGARSTWTIVNTIGASGASTPVLHVGWKTTDTKMGGGSSMVNGPKATRLKMTTMCTSMWMARFHRSQFLTSW